MTRSDAHPKWWLVQQARDWSKHFDEVSLGHANSMRRCETARGREWFLSTSIRASNLSGLLSEMADLIESGTESPR